MRAIFFWPAIYERPTGGNIYNRRLIQGLRQRMQVDVHVRGEERDAVNDSAKRSSARVGIIDSLLLQGETDLWDRLKPAKLDGFVLLVHYLHLVDPNQSESEDAERERQMLHLFDGFVTTSRYVRDQLCQEGVKADQVFLVRPGIDERFTVPLNRRSRMPPRILTVASLLRGKGLTEGVKALELLSEQDWHWQIIGDDTLDREYVSKLRQLLAQTPVGDRIELVGPVEADEIVTSYEAADLFFLPSRFETCSMVTMEAMARALPVVAFDVGGVGELVRNGTTGYLARSGATYAAAGYIRSLLEEPERRYQMGRAAHRASHAFETWDEAADRFYQMLATVNKRRTV